MTADDLNAIFLDTSLTIPVVFGAITTTGIFNIEDNNLASGIITSKVYSLVMKTSDFAVEPVAGASITVNSNDYKINSFQTIDDGQLCQLTLSLQKSYQSEDGSGFGDEQGNEVIP